MSKIKQVIVTVLAKARREPVAIRGALAAFLVAINRALIDVTEAIGVPISDIPGGDWAIANEAAIENGIGSVLAFVVFLTARAQVWSVPNLADAGGLIFDEESGE